MGNAPPEHEHDAGYPRYPVEALTQAETPSRRGRRVPSALLAAGLLLAAAALAALGFWQLERRAWKQDLIAAVDSRAHAPPVAPPPPAAWGELTAGSHGYLRVQVNGRYLPVKPELVKAVTELGGGYWVMQPLDTGPYRILVNRGFVPAGQKVAPPPSGNVSVTGLLRLTEPGGGFLRENDPAARKWYSRDVTAISAAMGSGLTAPYFIDADASAFEEARASGAGPGTPVGGLTVIRFSDHHMIYALTWFALAILAIGGAWIVWRPAGTGPP
ncbi:SURF1 family protein [Sandaracinobacteroides hominis]|uniref:SURF1 family protein n=1 Tax=Sandaracinobacteroides hominis TaxID=2780086 RepID=UPI002E2837BC|nr:SURF1 family cytochrome oxidase biogenesis protein [Sandaracinobacteroides hominis]